MHNDLYYLQSCKMNIGDEVKYYFTIVERGSLLRTRRDLRQHAVNNGNIELAKLTKTATRLEMYHSTHRLQELALLELATLVKQYKDDCLNMNHKQLSNQVIMAVGKLAKLV